MNFVFDHPVAVGLCVASVSVAVAVVALEYERLRAVRRPRVPLFMETWR